MEKNRQGLLHIYCGDGKGKTSAAVGMAVRAAGCGMKVLVIRFLKTENSGEVEVLRSIPGITVPPCERTFGFVFRMTEEQKQEAALYYQSRFEAAAKKAVQGQYDLLILDEIGRGTSTFDGMSIARAVLEYCADPKRLGAKTLFATHYHELTAMEGTLPGVKNYNIAVRTRGEEIVFLRKIVPGGADRSYGIEVAKLAGLPDSVLKRARAILEELESQSGRPAPTAPPEDQLSLAAMAESEAADTIRRTQVDSLSPLEALNLLYELKRRLS